MKPKLCQYLYFMQLNKMLIRSEAQSFVNYNYKYVKIEFVFPLKIHTSPNILLHLIYSHFEHIKSFS